MRTKFLLPLGAVIFIALVLYSCRKDQLPCDCNPANIKASVTVFATGLNNPRGLKFGPDGYLYVAEGGIGGTGTTSGCEQVIPPVGPYTGSKTGARISRINGAGTRSTFVDNLPSSTTAMGEVSGVADVAFIDNTMYALLAGAGCSHGVPSIPNAVIKINHDRSWKIIANLSAYQMAHPVKNPEPDDFEPDGSWYSMLNVDGKLFAMEPNHGELDKITEKGDISRVSDISASQGHVVPTAMVYHNGNFYVGNLSTFPIMNKSSIYKITPSGHVSVVATGFSTILGVAFDKVGGLYVLENTTGNPFPTPGTGDIVRIDPDGSRMIVVTGLNLPTGMIFGPDDKLYVSNWGFGPPAIGGGQVLKIDITCSKTMKNNKD
ncbi:MAG: ScyD/ScyE family protein [Chitinophagaceae bacterium]